MPNCRDHNSSPTQSALHHRAENAAPFRGRCCARTGYWLASDGAAQHDPKEIGLDCHGTSGVVAWHCPHQLQEFFPFLVKEMYSDSANFDVIGHFAIWLLGEPHAVIFGFCDYFSGNFLIHGQTSYLLSSLLTNLTPILVSTRLPSSPSLTTPI